MPVVFSLFLIVGFWVAGGASPARAFELEVSIRKTTQQIFYIQNHRVCDFEELLVLNPIAKYFKYKELLARTALSSNFKGFGSCSNDQCELKLNVGVENDEPIIYFQKDDAGVCQRYEAERSESNRETVYRVFAGASHDDLKSLDLITPRNRIKKPARKTKHGARISTRRVGGSSGHRSEFTMRYKETLPDSDEIRYKDGRVFILDLKNAPVDINHNTTLVKPQFLVE